MFQKIINRCIIFTCMYGRSFSRAEIVDPTLVSALPIHRVNSNVRRSSRSMKHANIKVFSIYYASLMRCKMSGSDCDGLDVFELLWRSCDAMLKVGRSGLCLRKLSVGFLAARVKVAKTVGLEV